MSSTENSWGNLSEQWITAHFDTWLLNDSGKAHYCDVIMTAMASQITSLTIVYSTVHSDADQSKHQSSAWLAFGRGIHRWPVNSPHKGPVTRKIHLMTSSWTIYSPINAYFAVGILSFMCICKTVGCDHIQWLHVFKIPQRTGNDPAIATCSIPCRWDMYDVIYIYSLF